MNPGRRWLVYLTRRRGVQDRRTRVAAGVVWLGFVAIPIVTAFTNHGPALGHWLAVAGAVTFTASYGWLILIWFDERTRRHAYALCAVQLALAAALTIADRSSWGFLFSYSAACVGLVVANPYGFFAVVGYAVAAVGITAIGGAGSGSALGYGISTIGVGLLLTLLRDLNMRNEELQEARAELARSAVAAERERFARDLHDLLGHSLSVIAIKAELARRLLPDRPTDAAGQLGDVEQVARQALSEVREAVSGYRQPTLKGEMEGAQVALAAAGIVAEFQRAPVSLDPEVEAVLAWAVREGATNVIRHSGASRCQVRVLAGRSDAGVEVVDDGAGPGGSGGSGAGGASGNGGVGNGLAGLGERAERLRGRIEAGALPDGGFRLSVFVPVSKAGTS